MEKIDDLKLIKKDYGEKMMHLCRELFPTILESPGSLYQIVSTHFEKSRFLFEDIINEDKKAEFKEYIYFLFDEKREENNKTTKSVKELLDEAGYKLFECKTNKDIQKFRKYYAKGEELCTFRDSCRIDHHHIFFIVKKNVDKIQRSANPKREDEYSLSVLDLQFDKGYKQRVSIKSRYNHTVPNPDAVYSNNLERIAVGLTEAFERDYGFYIGNEYKSNFELDNYVEARNGKFYKYNYEINNTHYCPNNTIIEDGDIVEDYSDKSRYTLMDYFILDEKEKRIFLFDPRIRDTFVDFFDEMKITDIKIANKEDCKEIVITVFNSNKATIKLDKAGKIIGYDNENLITASYRSNYMFDSSCNFLGYNTGLLELSLPNLIKCGNAFLYGNTSLKSINLPELKECGNGFLYGNTSLKSIHLPELKECGSGFLECNQVLQKAILPKLEKCGYGFLGNNSSLTSLELPNLKKCESFFLKRNRKLVNLYLPNLERCNDMFLNEVKLDSISLPKLKKCGDSFLGYANFLKSLELPNLEECGDCFLANNSSMVSLSLPKLQKCGDTFMYWNESLKELYAPNLKICNNDFLFFNRSLMKVDLSNLEICGNEFLANNKALKSLSLPNLQKCGDRFMLNNTDLNTLELPNLVECGDYFMLYNELLKSTPILNLDSHEYFVMRK